MADTAEKNPSARKLAVAASLLEALADGDFSRIATLVSDDVTLSALLPGGFRQWQGAAEIAATFDRWFGNAEQQNGTTMSTSNVAVDANGLELTDAANSTGGIVSSDPSDGQPGHTGFQIAPSPGKPVYVEYKATLPAAATPCCRSRSKRLCFARMSASIDSRSSRGAWELKVLTASTVRATTSICPTTGTQAGRSMAGLRISASEPARAALRGAGVRGSRARQ